MLFACIMLFYIDLCKCFLFHALSCFIDTYFVYFKYVLSSSAVLLICSFFLILCSHNFLCERAYMLSGEIALKNNHYYFLFFIWPFWSNLLKKEYVFVMFFYSPFVIIY